MVGESSFLGFVMPCRPDRACVLEEHSVFMFYLAYSLNMKMREACSSKKDWAVSEPHGITAQKSLL
jgi:hypothetical protein